MDLLLNVLPIVCGNSGFVFESLLYAYAAANLYLFVGFHLGCAHV